MMEGKLKISSKKGFWLIDPCAALEEDIYYGVWGDLYDFKEGIIEVPKDTLVVGTPLVCSVNMAILGTRIGDGTYMGNYCNYSVDSGTIAVIPAELLPENFTSDFGYYFEGVEAEFYWLDGYMCANFTGNVEYHEMISIEDDSEEDEEAWIEQDSDSPWDDEEYYEED